MSHKAVLLYSHPIAKAAERTVFQTALRCFLNSTIYPFVKFYLTFPYSVVLYNQITTVKAGINMKTLEEQIKDLKAEYETLNDEQKFMVYVYLSTLQYKQRQEQLVQQ